MVRSPSFPRRSIGTSLPELASSVAAVIAGDSSIVAGNVVGSNIANILLVLGAGAILAGSLSTTWERRDTDFAFLFGATFLFILFALDGAVSVCRNRSVGGPRLASMYASPFLITIISLQHITFSST